ncbi:hypothetical protein NIES592_12765 [Fischerella major NIES-592]|uniref:Uncharacterized protein n=1 Tax=Fischerella major NIES-592 TaxID=210994 RepID=A0A1U7GYG6_9CYAN|nr:hypothetical protein NIES592_12765 [Fischerella major NIES-592]
MKILDLGIEICTTLVTTGYEPKNLNPKSKIQNLKLARSSSGFAVLAFALHKLPEIASVGTNFPIIFLARAVDSLNNWCFGCEY